MTSPPLPAANDHRAWAQYWGAACARSIRLLGTGETTNAVEEELHAVRTAKQAWYHWMRLRPANRPPDGHVRQNALVVVAERKG